MKHSHLKCFCFFKTTFHCVLRLKNPVNRLWSLELDLKVLTYAQGWNIYLFLYLYTETVSSTSAVLFPVLNVWAAILDHSERGRWWRTVCSGWNNGHGPAMVKVQTIAENLKFCRGQQQRWLNIQVPRGARNSRYANHNCNNTNPHRCKNWAHIPTNSVFQRKLRGRACQRLFSGTQTTVFSVCGTFTEW